MTHFEQEAAAARLAASKAGAPRPPNKAKHTAEEAAARRAKVQAEKEEAAKAALERADKKSNSAETAAINEKRRSIEQRRLKGEVVPQKEIDELEQAEDAVKVKRHTQQLLSFAATCHCQEKAVFC